MIISNLFTTSSFLSLSFLRIYSGFGLILLGVSILCDEYSADFCHCLWLSYLKVSWDLGEICWNTESNIGVAQPVGILLAPTCSISTQWCQITIFKLFSLQSILLISSLLPQFLSLFHSHISHHDLDRWSAGTECVVFHLSTNSWHPAISSACTHYRFSQSVNFIKYIACPSIHFHPATSSTSTGCNSSELSAGVVLEVQICRVPYTPSLQVNNSSVDYHLCSLQAPLHLALPVNRTQSSGRFFLHSWFLAN